jgi:hypothetical protein
MTPALAQELARIGVVLPAAPVPRPAPTRPAGDPRDWKGVWYPDGNIPH